MDFQTREPVSPVIAAMPRTRLAVELQVTQEYTGQQRHVCYLGPLWSEVLGFGPWGADGPTSCAARRRSQAAGGGRGARRRPGRGRPTWATTGSGPGTRWPRPTCTPSAGWPGTRGWTRSTILDEWIDADLPAVGDRRPAAGAPDAARDAWTTPGGPTSGTPRRWASASWSAPATTTGPDVDGYEYTPWGTYHFADRDGVGVDRTRATGHRLHRPVPAALVGGLRVARALPRRAAALLPPRAVRARAAQRVDGHPAHLRHPLRRGRARCGRCGGGGTAAPGWSTRRSTRGCAERLDEQVRCAEEWRDQINTYFFRKSGVPDAHGRRIY